MRYRQTREIWPNTSRPRSLRHRGQAYAVENSSVKRSVPRVSFTVMAHPKREQWAVGLARQLDCNITWDEKNDRHDTGLRAIKAYDSSADYHCVVQDDAILAEGFADALPLILQYPEPGCPVGLYYGAKDSTNSLHAQAISYALDNGGRWLVRKGPVWGPAIVYPTDNISPLIDYFEDSIVENYDRRVMSFYQSQGILCWYSVPSLVDHRQEGNQSLCGHDRGIRQARVFCGPQNALEVDWSGPVVKASM